MNVIERYITEKILTLSPWGKVVDIIPNHHCIYALSDFTSDIIENLWTKIIISLTEQKLIHGVLDVPIVQQCDYAIIWVKKFKIFCYATDINLNLNSIQCERPSPPPAITLAIGGPTGVGKTTLIRRLLTSTIGDRVTQYIAYTTRPMRSHEIDGVDYHFVKPKDISSYQKKSNFTGFIEARGYWYWIDPLNFFKVRWSKPDTIHVFSITQVDEFLKRREITSDLHWIWLDASPKILQQRLEKRNDQNINQSLTQNLRLQKQDRTGLVSLYINTDIEDIDTSLQRVKKFIHNKEMEIP